MAKHKNRSGKLVTSFSCKEERHGVACEKFLAEIDRIAGTDSGAIVCHCSCHPDDGCRETIRRKPRRQQTCSRCNLQHAGEC